MGAALIGLDRCCCGVGECGLARLSRETEVVSAESMMLLQRTSSLLTVREEGLLTVRSDEKVSSLDDVLVSVQAKKLSRCMLRGWNRCMIALGLMDVQNALTCAVSSGALLFVCAGSTIAAPAGLRRVCWRPCCCTSAQMPELGSRNSPDGIPCEFDPGPVFLI